MLVPARRTWQVVNHAHALSIGLESLEVFVGGLTLAGLFSRRLGLIGALLAFATPFGTLSFLIKTPKAWVPSLGNAKHGFPFLAGPGRLVLKHVTLLSRAWLSIVDTARVVARGPASRGGDSIGVRDGDATSVAGGQRLVARLALERECSFGNDRHRTMEGRRRLGHMGVLMPMWSRPSALVHRAGRPAPRLRG